MNWQSRWIDLFPLGFSIGNFFNRVCMRISYDIFFEEDATTSQTAQATLVISYGGNVNWPSGSNNLVPLGFCFANFLNRICIPISHDMPFYDNGSTFQADQASLDILHERFGGVVISYGADVDWPSNLNDLFLLGFSFGNFLNRICISISHDMTF